MLLSIFASFLKCFLLPESSIICSVTLRSTYLTIAGDLSKASVSTPMCHRTIPGLQMTMPVLELW
jgi:hypothetical protein